MKTISKMNEEIVYPYIAKIVEVYETGNGNLFCREEGKSELDHHLDWPIFIPKELVIEVPEVPFYGIIVIETHKDYFNNGKRQTCRVFSADKNELTKIFNEEEELINEIKLDLLNYKKTLSYCYKWDERCLKAVDDLKHATSLKLWIDKYAQLYTELDLQKVSQLSNISKVNFNNFNNIEKFIPLYSNISSLFKND